MRRKMEHLREEREQIRQLRNVSEINLSDLICRNGFNLENQQSIWILFSVLFKILDCIISSVNMCHVYLDRISVIYTHFLLESRIQVESNFA